MSAQHAPVDDLEQAISRNVAAALAEDIGDGDRTAALVPADHILETQVIAREPAILAGRRWFEESFRQLDDHVVIRWAADDGEAVERNQLVCGLRGPARAILSGERTALNFLQTLSATATQAHRYVEAVTGTHTTILDTRKTLPGLRQAQKYAVRCGGAKNHRAGLFDAVLIKENHIAAAGSIKAAVERALAAFPELLIEVEVENLDQLEESVQAGARRALLDNFTRDKLRVAVQNYHGRIELEASGNIALENVRSIAECGVDFISTGDMTKNVAAIDFSMRFV